MSNGIINGNVMGAYLVQAAFNPGSVDTITTEEETATVQGVKVGDMVVVTKPTLTAGLGIVGARVSAANTVIVTFVNPTAAPIDAGSETYTFLVFRPEGNVAANIIAD